MGIGAAALIGISAASSIMGGMAQKAQLDSQADALKTSYQLDKSKRKRDKSYFLGKQRAAVGASGIEMSGSPLEVINDSMYEFELDEQIAKENYLMRRSSLKQQGKLAMIGGVLGAVQSGASAFGGKTGMLPGSSPQFSMQKGLLPGSTAQPSYYTQLPVGWSK